MEEYEYVATLGEGAYGFVWKCVERATGRLVAIKGFKQAHVEPEIMRLAIREVRVLQMVKHPAIIPLIDSFRSKSGRVYLVFPYVGRSAFQEVDARQDGLPPPRLKLLVWQLLQALTYLHRRKIVHRDIKPGNILLSESGEVKLCDFGFARPTQCGPRDVEKMSSYVVTRWYRAPEVLVGSPYGPSADIWSLGCTLAELASGQPLFPGKSTGEQLWRIMRCFGPLPASQSAHMARDPGLARVRVPVRGRPLRERLQGCDPGLFALVEACLQPDPGRRPSAGEMLRVPYLWGVPKLLAGTPLEHLYGGLSMRTQQERRQDRLQQQQQQQRQPNPQRQEPPQPRAQQWVRLTEPLLAPLTSALQADVIDTSPVATPAVLQRRRETECRAAEHCPPVLSSSAAAKAAVADAHAAAVVGMRPPPSPPRAAEVLTLDTSSSDTPTNGDELLFTAATPAAAAAGRSTFWNDGTLIVSSQSNLMASANDPVAPPSLHDAVPVVPAAMYDEGLLLLSMPQDLSLLQSVPPPSSPPPPRRLLATDSAVTIARPPPPPAAAAKPFYGSRPTAPDATVPAAGYVPAPDGTSFFELSGITSSVPDPDAFFGRQLLTMDRIPGGGGGRNGGGGGGTLLGKGADATVFAGCAAAPADPALRTRAGPPAPNPCQGGGGAAGYPTASDALPGTASCFVSASAAATAAANGSSFVGPSLLFPAPGAVSGAQAQFNDDLDLMTTLDSLAGASVKVLPDRSAVAIDDLLQLSDEEEAAAEGIPAGASAAAGAVAAVCCRSGSFAPDATATPATATALSPHLPPQRLQQPSMLYKSLSFIWPHRYHHHQQQQQPQRPQGLQGPQARTAEHPPVSLLLTSTDASQASALPAGGGDASSGGGGCGNNSRPQQPLQRAQTQITAVPAGLAASPAHSRQQRQRGSNSVNGYAPATPGGAGARSLMPRSSTLTAATVSVCAPDLLSGSLAGAGFSSSSASRRDGGGPGVVGRDTAGSKIMQAWAAAAITAVAEAETSPSATAAAAMSSPGVRAAAAAAAASMTATMAAAAAAVTAESTPSLSLGEDCPPPQPPPLLSSPGAAAASTAGGGGSASAAADHSSLLRVPSGRRVAPAPRTLLAPSSTHLAAAGCPTAATASSASMAVGGGVPNSRSRLSVVASSLSNTWVTFAAAPTAANLAGEALAGVGAELSPIQVIGVADARISVERTAAAAGATALGSPPLLLGSPQSRLAAARSSSTLRHRSASLPSAGSTAVASAAAAAGATASGSGAVAAVAEDARNEGGHRRALLRLPHSGSKRWTSSAAAAGDGGGGAGGAEGGRRKAGEAVAAGAVKEASRGSTLRKLLGAVKRAFSVGDGM